MTVLIAALVILVGPPPGGAATPPSCGGRPATLVGTPEDDRLTGTTGDDVIVGLAGDDVIRGRGGNDRLCGDDGDDLLLGGPGNDLLAGGAGDDRLEASDGDDELEGGPGDDRLRGGNGDDRLSAGEGDDSLAGSPGDDVLDGGPGTDRLKASDGRDVCGAGEHLRGCEDLGQPVVPRYEVIDRGSDPAHPCAGDVPVDPRVACGWLTVREDRDRPGGPTLRLPVVIVHSAAAAPRPDPIVYFEGGPGYGATGLADYFLEEDFGGPRDVILFDQRGTGRSQPSLDCPEVDEATWANFGAAGDPRTELVVAQDAFAACRERLTAAGVDLNAYDTLTSAADVADLRSALGVDEWNLFGVSYGTTLALATMRAHPEGVRSVVIDSVYPTTVAGGPETLAALADQALQRVYDGCAADPACARAVPDLEGMVRQVVDLYNRDPHESTITDPNTGRRRPIAITGNDILAGLFSVLYDDELIRLVPTLASDFLARRTGFLDAFGAIGIPESVEAAEAMTASVECSDRAAFPEDLDAVLADRPEYSTLLSGFDCDEWGVQPALPGFNDPVTSAIPTLVLAGTYDPVTPPADSRAAADALDKATFVEFPGLGHGEVFSDDCPEAVFREFVGSPSALVDSSCVASLGPPDWVLPTAPAA